MSSTPQILIHLSACVICCIAAVQVIKHGLHHPQKFPIWNISAWAKSHNFYVASAYTAHIVFAQSNSKFKVILWLMAWVDIPYSWHGFFAGFVVIYPVELTGIHQTHVWIPSKSWRISYFLASIKTSQTVSWRQPLTSCFISWCVFFANAQDSFQTGWKTSG